MNSRRSITALGAVALFALAAWGLWPSGDGAGGASSDARGARGAGGGATVAVETGPVSRRDIADVAFYTGTLEPGSQFMLASKAGGRLRSLLVDIGDPVERGQIIARLDDEEFVQDVAEQQASLDVVDAQLGDARAQHEMRRRAYERVADLRRRNLVSESEYDLSRLEYDAAGANVRVAEAQKAQRQAALRAAELRRSYATVRAEWNGSGSDLRFVGERFVNEGANVAANEPLISVIGVDRLRAVTFVTDRDFARLQIGQTTRITSDARPGEAFEGRVQRIAPLLREDSRQARVEIAVENQDRRLSPGFFVSIEVDVQALEDALVVPRDALTRHNGQRGVFLIDADDLDGREANVRWVPVTEGVRTDEYVQVLEPQISGRVVTLGQHRLSDGSRVRMVVEEREKRIAG